jgi:hypothetical protein
MPRHGPLGAMRGAPLGVLTCMLARTCGLAAARCDTRRPVLRDDVNALGLPAVRAGMRPGRRALFHDDRDTWGDAVQGGRCQKASVGLRQRMGASGSP